MHADDGFDRARAVEPKRIISTAPSPCTLDAPAGDTAIWVQRGFRYLPWRQTVKLAAGADRTLPVKLQPQRPARLVRDVAQRRPARPHELWRHLPEHAGEPRRGRPRPRTSTSSTTSSSTRRSGSPTSAISAPDPDPASGDGVLILHAQEYHTSFWGHLGLLHLVRPCADARFLGLPAHRARQPLSAQRRDRRPGARAGRRWSATSIRSTGTSTRRRKRR